jgi:asparagine synthase (glutamine-hydrolysing)
MCGIAGLFYADSSKPPDAGVLKAMGDAISHRGPDAEGFLAEPGFGLVHRRLSIIDLAGGDQPIGNEDGSVQIVFNGEIYNYQQLRAGLEARGHSLRTHSDTEVIVHLYEDEGERLVERLRGMFTFAIWDRPRRRLLLARDRLGIKPLYVYRDTEKLLFASELKAILAHPGVPRRIDHIALEDYLAYGMVPGPRSIFQGIEKLPPAHTLSARAGELDMRPRRYWQLHFETDPRPTTNEWLEAVRSKVDEAVRLHLISDVPVGAFLSGGLDSSTVVASAAGVAAASMETFAIGFNEETFSELPYARAVADRFGTRHTEHVVTPDAVGLLDRLVHHFDEPFADSSAVPTFLVSELAARRLKVALSGDGGDEAFGGYARYAHDLKEAAVRRHLPAWMRRGLGQVARVWPKADWLPRPMRAKTLLSNLALDADQAYANTIQVCRQPLRRRLLAVPISVELNGHHPEASVRAGYASAPSGNPLAGMIAADVATLLPDDYLVKVDRASMAHGLEVRPPLLDHELLELTARIPPELKIRSGETKWVMKRAFHDRLPEVVRTRPKQGFEIPVDSWLRGPLREMVEEAVFSPRARVAEFIEQPAARTLYRSHRAGVGRHGQVLWGLMVLARWCDRYLGPSEHSHPTVNRR